MVKNAEKIIYKRLTPALKGQETDIPKKHWDEIVVALGEVAAGVAHEIRNPLTGIKGFSQLLQDGFKPNDKEWPYIKNILKETQKIENLIEELLMLSRPTFPRKRWVLLDNLIDDVLPELAGEAVDRRVKIVTEYDEVLDYVKVDSSQMKIVLFQLAKSSIQSMEEGQVLVISTCGTNDGEYNEVSFTRPESHHLEGHINLGAAAVKRIIENHQGILKTQYLKDTGSRITIKLPKSS